MDSHSNESPIMGSRLVVRKIAILPTLLTLGNAVSGFAAIALASLIDRTATLEETSFYFSISGALIVLAMLFDALDGYVARLSKSASDFGAQLDSLCDAISFGLAPAFLLLRLGQVDWAESELARNAIGVVAALYMVCTILRLARFNLETTTDPASHKRFKGLPSPGAAGCVASLVVLRSGVMSVSWVGLDANVLNQFIRVFAPVGGLLVALLMVSRLPYPHFTNQMFGGKRPFRFLIQALLILFIIRLMPSISFFLGFWLYALSSPVRYVLGLGIRRRKGMAADRIETK
jgi:CDP-diacylglycerol---serine O-phosphatidyltransferase